MVRRTYMALIDCGCLHWNDFPVAKSGAAQSNPEEFLLAGLLDAPAVVARELQQRPNQPVAHRFVNDCGFGCLFQAMGYFSRLHRYCGLPQNLSPCGWIVNGTDLSAATWLAFGRDINRAGSSLICSATARLCV